MDPHVLTPVPPTSSSGNTSHAPASLSRSPPLPPHSPAASVLILVVVTAIILVTVVGNVLVVLAVFTSRALRAPQNLFLVSLASADILVATLVIPFSLANEIMGYWYFGSTWCSFYLALDVLFCTSSIVHLCAISLDRYWSVTKAVSYNGKRTPKRIKVMIGVVWMISVVISSPPLLVTHTEETSDSTGGIKRPQRQECLLNNQTWYILSSCLVSFFVPGVIMILVYCKIYRVAKQRASTIFVAKNAVEAQPSQSETCFGGTPRSFQRVSKSDVPLPEKRQELDQINFEEKTIHADVKKSSFRTSRHFRRSAQLGAARRLEAPPPSCASVSWVSSDHCSQHLLLASPLPLPSRRLSLSKSKVAQMREKRFTFVLAVVMGVFVLCWFPFFFTYSLHAVCRDKCTIPDTLFDLFFWIGYCNSCLNPIIYTIFNRDFRRAFKRILFQTH
uniref:alpha-2Db adrenergic receptor-like n=1 Tax=Doryrhamphus excisus TaxID=161450 RepID=UPI0025AE972E|nr:alpha-2Db adrenergic receptor-like [Doryrhamphus excisus]